MLKRKPVLRADWEACDSHTCHKNGPNQDTPARIKALCEDARRSGNSKAGGRKPCELCVAKLMGNRARKLNLALMVSFSSSCENPTSRSTWRSIAVTSVQQAVALSSLQLCGVHAVPALRGKQLVLDCHSFK